MFQQSICFLGFILSKNIAIILFFIYLHFRSLVDVAKSDKLMLSFVKLKLWALALLFYRTVKATKAAQSTPTGITLPLHRSRMNAPGIARSRWLDSPLVRRSGVKEVWRTWWTHWNRRSSWSSQRQNKTVRHFHLLRFQGKEGTIKPPPPF